MSYPGVQISPQHKFMQQTHTTPIKQNPKKTMWQRIVVFMDFDLLKDPVYLNLVFGLSIFYVAEQNFKMVTPFFFQDIGYDKSDVALFLSVQALTDILARLILPPICDRLTISKRTLFMTGIFVLGICRSGNYLFIFRHDMEEWDDTTIKIDFPFVESYVTEFTHDWNIYLKLSCIGPKIYKNIRKDSSFFKFVSYFL